MKGILNKNKIFRVKNNQNTIYIAFGTIVTLNNHQLTNILKGTLKNEKNYALLAIRKESLLNANTTINDIYQIYKDRIKIAEWVDQQYVLSHPAIKLFITHGYVYNLLKN